MQMIYAKLYQELGKCVFSCFTSNSTTLWYYEITMSKLCVRNSCGIKNRLKGCNLKCTGFLLLFHLCITFFNFCFLLYVNQSLDRDIFLDYGIAFENNSITINQFKQGKSYKWLLTFSQEFYGENLKKILFDLLRYYLRWRYRAKYFKVMVS